MIWHHRWTTTAVRCASVAHLLKACARSNVIEGDGEPWLDDVLKGVRDVLDLVDHAESDIIATAARARKALEAIVTQPGFMPSSEQVVRSRSEVAAATQTVSAAE